MTRPWIARKGGAGAASRQWRRRLRARWRSASVAALVGLACAAASWSARAAARPQGQAAQGQPGQGQAAQSQAAQGQAAQGQETGVPAAQAPGAARVDYARQIQPLFERSCYECHGPGKGRGQLRLHESARALKGGFSGPVILPGNSKDSLLVRRILGLDHEDRMPLKKPPLSDAEIALIARWINEGAAWPAAPTETTAQAAGTAPRPGASAGPASGTGATSGTDRGPGPSPGAGTVTGVAASAGAAAGAADDDPAEHWAYVRPTRPAVPASARGDWARNDIDRFVLARLEKEGLTPSHEPSKTTLLRRVSLDLIGLPPNLDEIDAFVADTRPDAYERVVDRLLASPRYGERWARPWLDLARYADSDGFDKDNRRVAWPYRDWVIDALNADMPFDRFTVEQIAGDMLPGATTAQQIATGFHRNTQFNLEGGVDAEESRYAMLVDRVNTTATVWLGQTLGCAQCHNHKYDPFSQQDYYRLMAFFQSSDYTPRQQGADGIYYFEPQLDLASADQAAKRDALQKEIAKHQAAFDVKSPALALAQSRWEARLRTAHTAWTTLTPATLDGTGGVTLTAEADGSIVASGANPERTTYTIVATTTLARITGVRLEALPDKRLPQGGPGRDAYGHFRMTGITIDAAPARGGPAAAKPVPLTTVKVDDGLGSIDEKIFFSRTPVERGQPTTAWTIDATKEGTRVPRQAVLTPARPFGYAGGTRLTIRLAHLDGALAQGLGRFRLSVTGAIDPLLIVGIPAKLRPTLTMPAAKRAPERVKDLDTQFRRATPLLARPRTALADARKALAELQTQIPTAQVMREKPSFERPSVLLRERGTFTAPGPRIYAGIPSALHPMPDSQPMNRLGLAQWLVDEKNPLVARVAVNRLWEQTFGRGIVETSEDFGTQGALPSHPELLDWLATEMVARKWSQKAMLRLMVTSATYRQDSRVTPALRERDPYNRLLARGPRFRMEAEMIRDATLAAAGLLSAKMHGPSVYPPQPDGVWNVAANSDRWITSTGEDRYRRGLYTFARRTSPYPTMLALDATSREFCTVRRVRTDTPLQALALMNDEAFVEAAQALARKLLADPLAGQTIDSRLTYAMRRILARPPLPAEAASLKALFDRQQRFYADPANVEQARALIAPRADAANHAGTNGPRGTNGTNGTGAAIAAPKDAAPLDPRTPEIAAWTIVCNVLLNLDEALTKE